MYLIIVPFIINITEVSDLTPLVTGQSDDL